MIETFLIGLLVLYAIVGGPLWLGMTGAVLALARLTVILRTGGGR